VGRELQPTPPVKTDHRSKRSSWILVRTIWIVLLFLPSGTTPGQELLSTTRSAISSVGVGDSSHCRIIYLGFVGALEPPNNKHSGVVQIREALKGKGYSDVCANSFSPYAFAKGRGWLLQHFPPHSGELTADELQHSPKVILVGHSMGGWATLSLARELRTRNIPVELTIQVDSVGITDHTVPSNVKSAAIFHANDVLLLLTTKHLRREDPAHTQFVANVNVDGAGHESITRDPRIRALVLETVENLRASSEKSMLDLAHAAPDREARADRQ
jgi:pimeloyl-ACP methyl ester carboxylesterase